jgi:hypothetical protein
LFVDRKLGNVIPWKILINTIRRLMNGNKRRGLKLFYPLFRFKKHKSESEGSGNGKEMMVFFFGLTWVSEPACAHLD